MAATIQEAYLANDDSGMEADVYYGKGKSKKGKGKGKFFYTKERASSRRDNLTVEEISA